MKQRRKKYQEPSLMIEFRMDLLAELLFEKQGKKTIWKNLGQGTDETRNRLRVSKDIGERKWEYRTGVSRQNAGGERRKDEPMDLHAPRKGIALPKQEGEEGRDSGTGRGALNQDVLQG